MRKIGVVGIHSEDNFICITVKKEPDFFIWLYKLLEPLGVDKETITYCGHITEKDEYVEKKKRLEEFTDESENYAGNKGIKIEVYYGKNKVFVSIRNISKVCREKLMDVFREISLWKGVTKK